MSLEPTRYPEDSLQDLLGFTLTGAQGWWERQREGAKLERGALIHTYVAHAHVAPLEVAAAPGRDAWDPEDATLHLRPFDLGAGAGAGAEAPVAALPPFPGERLQLRRGRVAPAVALSHLHAYPPQPSEARAWVTAPLVQVVPCFEASRWPAPLVASVRQAQHPQYVWDRLPTQADAPVIFRLDQAGPLHRADTASYRLTGYRLSAAALELLDAWMAWFWTGTIAEDSDLLAAHTTLRELFGAAS
ncbi:MAG: hypothetical protein R3A79_07530 [Nannocystaceae bacterium]